MFLPSVSSVQIPFALRPLFYGRSRFRLPPEHPLPSGTTLRPFESRDRAICLAIYKGNEHDHFPDGFMVLFEFCLDSEDFLKLVLCVDDVPVAVGAVSSQSRLALTNAWLTFGMVSLGHQGKGLGSALLVARLSLLPKPAYSARLFMTNVETSQAFYAGFGFAPYGASPSGLPDLMLPCKSALLGPREWQACRERVADLGLTLPTIEARPPRTMSPARAKATTRAQIAVLVQVFGLIVLLALDGPYNWCGLVFVLWGVFLYRRERKRLQMRIVAALRKRYGYSATP